MPNRLPVALKHWLALWMPVSWLRSGAALFGARLVSAPRKRQLMPKQTIPSAETGAPLWGVPLPGPVSAPGSYDRLVRVVGGGSMKQLFF